MWLCLALVLILVKDHTRNWAIILSMYIHWDWPNVTSSSSERACFSIMKKEMVEKGLESELSLLHTCLEASTTFPSPLWSSQLAVMQELNLMAPLPSWFLLNFIISNNRNVAEGVEERASLPPTTPCKVTWGWLFVLTEYDMVYLVATFGFPTILLQDIIASLIPSAFFKLWATTSSLQFVCTLAILL